MKNSLHVLEFHLAKIFQIEFCGTFDHTKVIRKWLVDRSGRLAVGFPPPVYKELRVGGSLLKPGFVIKKNDIFLTAFLR